MPGADYRSNEVGMPSERIKPPAVEEGKLGGNPEEWKLRESIRNTVYGLRQGVSEEEIRKHLTKNPQAKYWYEPEDVAYILKRAKEEIDNPMAEAVPEAEREAKIKYFRQQETKWRETAYKIAEEGKGEVAFAEAIKKADEFGAKASDLEALKPPAVKEAKLGGNPLPGIGEILATIDRRPKKDIIESKLRQEFGDAIIDRLRENRYVTAGSAGPNPPLLVTLKGREVMQKASPTVTPTKPTPLPEIADLLPMPITEGPPLPKALGLKWPWKE